ncbi:DUF2796 domain-containing protein [Magnetospira thiophila]
MNSLYKAASFSVPLGLWVLIQVAPVTVWAESQPHEHGVGHLNLAIEGHDLEIELAAPGADIVGFEHEPTTPEQRAAIEQAETKLKAGADLFYFPGSAGCELKKVEVESAHMEDHHGEEQAHKQADHEKDHKDGESEEHAEFHAHYHFECADTGAVTYMETRFFEVFPAAQELEVQYITSRGQGAAELKSTDPRLTF